MSLWILSWVVGSPAPRALIGIGAPAHLIREIPCAPVGTRSRRICRLIRAREGCLAQGFGSPSRHFYPDRLKSVKAADETLERCRCGGIDQEMSGTIPMIGAVLPSCSAL